MPKIKILPEILSNKIAAGEVVERPASVVKELVENAIDAGSTRIIIEVEKGGRSLIRVSDNGVGMSHDDALLSLERYATSKISKDRDLFAINTLGFRGEALPSIASVSRFELVSRVASADAGTEILVDGGKIKKVSEVGAPKGTMVTVRQLFFNTPARRKFLKTIATEMGHIADRVASMALGFPDVQVRLIHNGKIIKNWPITPSSFERIVDVLGSDLKNNLHAIKFQENGISISGWTSSPRVTRRTSRGLYVYVNGRLVRDRIIQHALFEGYSQRLVKGRFPLAVVFINVPFDEVDVNVHPTKNEVRFARQRDVHEAVRRAVAQTLYDTDRADWGAVKYSQDSGYPGQHRIAETKMKEFEIRKAEGGKEDLEFGSRDAEVGMMRVDGHDQLKDSDGDNVADSGRLDNSAIQTRRRAKGESQVPIWQKKRFGDMRAIGQFYNTYIVCESQEGLILIDQHAAHERILFEKFSIQSAEASQPVQRLLVPETIELGFREAEILEKMLLDLKALGLEIEPFGGNTFVVKAVPGLLADREIKPLVIEIVEKIAEIGAAPGLTEALEKCRMVMACHGAIRAHQKLSDEQIKGLLGQLDDCRNPSHCPHGRPTWIRWDLRALEKLFNRIV